MPVRIPEPWRRFLADVDQQLMEPAAVHCLGGFVLTVLWGLPRATNDLDFIEIDPATANEPLLRIAGAGSELARKYQVEFQRVTIADHPEGYVSRLIDMTPGSLKKLRLLAFEVHDLVLAKIGRFAPRDRDDIGFLVRQKALDLKVLIQRYEEELRPYLLNETRYKLNLDLCLEEFFPGENPKGT